VHEGRLCHIAQRRKVAPGINRHAEILDSEQPILILVLLAPLRAKLLLCFRATTP
jgi:hypothetical protein